jgi:uncharacterized protein (TIGR02147 family)
MKNNLPSIFDYSDFRKFLSDYFESRHIQDKKFTKAAFCKKIGLPHTRGYLNEIIKGRSVTSGFADRISKALQFNEEEYKYFRVLVEFCQATTENERELHLEHLISLNRSPKKTLDSRMFVLYKQWYHSVIRAFLDVENFKDDYIAISRRLLPPITAKEVEESIKLLSSLGLINKDDNGFWKPTDKSISTPSYLQDEIIIEHQLSLLEFAKRSLLENRLHPQNITTNTISISNEGFKRLEKRLEKFRAEVRSLIVKDEIPAQKVYQLNIQLFPATK